MPLKEKNTGKQTNRVLIVLLLILVAIIIFAGIVIFVLLSKENKEADNEKNKNFLVTEDNVDDVIQEMQETDTSVPASYDVKMNNSWYFEDGEAQSSNAAVSNYKTNNNTVYFDVILSDTGETVYSSPYLKVGDEIANFSLDKVLSAGEYKAICKYYILNDDLEMLCTTAVNITITIAN